MPKNAQINKANCQKTSISNSYQNVLSNANKPDLLKSYDMQQTTVNALKAIGEAPISDYTDEWKKVQIPDYNTDFDTTILEIYATKSVIAIDEVIGFHIVTSIELVEVEWDFGDGEVSSQKDNILKSFSKEGSYNVRLKALVEVENKDYINDKSQDKFVIKEYFRDLEILVC